MPRLVNILAWLVVLFLLAPLMIIAAGSFTTTSYVAFPPVGFTLRWYNQLMQRPDFLSAFVTSIVIALFATAISLVLGILAAIALQRANFRGKHLMESFLASPLILPTIVTGIALLQFYYYLDMEAALTGLVIGHVLITVPYVLRTVGAGLVALDQSLEEAASSLGAGPLRILWRVILPALSPSIVASSIFVFIMSFDQATVSIFLSTPDVVPLPVRIYTYIDLAIDPMIASVSTFMIGFALILVALLHKLVGLDKAFSGSSI
jgi:putative spermidine/putrescine transport system permease protein